MFDSHTEQGEADLPEEDTCSILDRKAKGNLEIVFRLVPEVAIKPPNINDIYFNARLAEISIVPRDLQLPWLFNNYNVLAHGGFTTFAPGLNADQIRAIWYYALDGEHSFCRWHYQVRYNLIAMAYLWALDFPHEFCGPGDEIRGFVMAYINAWFGYIGDSGDVDITSFQAQEAFIKMWIESDMDLLMIRDRKEMKGLQTLVRKLSRQSLPPSLTIKVEIKVTQIVQMRQEGKISDDEFATYGPALILQYVLEIEKLSEKIKQTRNSIRDIYHQEAARRMARRIGGDNPLHHVDWASDLVDSLMNAVDPEHENPKQLQAQNRPALTRSPWIDVETMVHILRSGFEKLKQEEDEMASVFEDISLEGEADGGQVQDDAAEEMEM